jgi:tRNA 2-thiouridine synthesizing protein A
MMTSFKAFCVLSQTALSQVAVVSGVWRQTVTQNGMSDEPIMGEHSVHLVDCIGLKCPLPVLRARKALLGLAPGNVVQVESSDPMAILDLPHMAREEGHVVVGQKVDGARATFWIRRG